MFQATHFSQSDGFSLPYNPMCECIHYNFMDQAFTSSCINYSSIVIEKLGYSNYFAIRGIPKLML